MSIIINNKNISKIYLGNKLIKSISLNNKNIWIKPQNTIKLNSKKESN